MNEKSANFSLDEISGQLDGHHMLPDVFDLLVRHILFIGRTNRTNFTCDCVILGISAKMTQSVIEEIRADSVINE